MKSGFYYTNSKRKKAIKPLNLFSQYNFTIKLPKMAIIIAILFPMNFLWFSYDFLCFPMISYDFLWCSIWFVQAKLNKDWCAPTRGAASPKNHRIKIKRKSSEIMGNRRKIIRNYVFLVFLFCWHVLVNYWLIIGLNWLIKTLELLLILFSVN